MQFTHTQKEFIKNFQIKNSGKNHDFYGQSNTLLSADEFEDLQNMSWNIWTWPCLFSHRTNISMTGSL